MRYSVRYRVEDRRWLVIDTADGNQVLSVHQTKAEAYSSAAAAQSTWRSENKAGEELARTREVISHTMAALSSRGKISAEGR